MSRPHSARESNLRVASMVLGGDAISTKDKRYSCRIDASLKTLLKKNIRIFCARLFCGGFFMSKKRREFIKFCRRNKCNQMFEILPISNIIERRTYGYSFVPIRDASLSDATTCGPQGNKIRMYHHRKFS